MTKSKHTAKKKSTSPKTIGAEKDPEYMVRINDPAMLRKDLLESLREIIIFMQGYEKFRQVQEEKVATFSLLKEHVRELNRLIDSKLRGYFPKGKLKAVTEEEREKELGVETKLPAKKIVPSSAPKQVISSPALTEEASGKNELEELEAQLRDIENELKNIK